MKAWVGQREGNQLTYRIAELPAPLPGEGEVLLRVRALGLNLVDRFPKRAHFVHSPASPANVPGLECAGEVAAAPAGSRWRPGDRVMAMVHGAAAPYALAQTKLLMPVPPDMPWPEAAAIPVSYLTAHDALVTAGKLARGGTVLVQGASTAVGLAAVQLARLHSAAWIAGTSRSEEKLARIDLDLRIITPAADLAQRVLSETGGRGVDVVIDLLGASVLGEAMRATAAGGRIVNVGRFAGVRGEIDLEFLSMRRLSLIGVSFRTRSLEQHEAVVAAFLRDHAQHLANRTLRPVVDQIFPFERLPEAIARAQRGEQFGKLVVEIPESLDEEVT